MHPMPQYGQVRSTYLCRGVRAAEVDAGKDPARLGGEGHCAGHRRHLCHRHQQAVEYI